MNEYEAYLARGRAQHGDKFDDSALAPAFVRYFRTGQRVKVTRTYADGAEVYTRTGTVSATTGWCPAFLLMHRSSDHGSSDLLSAKDVIVAVQHGRTYVPVGPREMVYVNVNEDGAAYGAHRTIEPALRTQEEFPNDSVLTVVADSAQGRRLIAEVREMERTDRKGAARRVTN